MPLEKIQCHAPIIQINIDPYEDFKKNCSEKNQDLIFENLVFENDFINLKINTDRHNLFYSIKNLSKKEYFCQEVSYDLHTLKEIQKKALEKSKQNGKRDYVSFKKDFCSLFFSEIINPSLKKIKTISGKPH